jgi:hypothetical protein
MGVLERAITVVEGWLTVLHGRETEFCQPFDELPGFAPSLLTTHLKND